MHDLFTILPLLHYTVRNVFAGLPVLWSSDLPLLRHTSRDVSPNSLVLCSTIRDVFNKLPAWGHIPRYVFTGLPVLYHALHDVATKTACFLCHTIRDLFSILPLYVIPHVTCSPNCRPVLHST